MKTIIGLSIAIALAFTFAGCEPGGVIITAQETLITYVPFSPRPIILGRRDGNG